MKSFDGMYYKHQKGGQTAALIVGRAAKNAFIQVITNQASYCLNYPLSDFIKRDYFKIGGNIFSSSGIKIHINSDNALISGEIKYNGLTPLRYDIMGPFKYLPLQCRHRIESLFHRLEGSLNINGEIIDFTGGIGYIEGDSGTSFPKSYTWIQCSDFLEKACITASVADIPFGGFRFQGCICAVYLNGKEYRMATYLGVKILCCSENLLILKQGGLRLEIEIDSGAAHKLFAPENGEMLREIHERVICGARFRFAKDKKVLFDRRSENASFEYVI